MPDWQNKMNMKNNSIPNTGSRMMLTKYPARWGTFQLIRSQPGMTVIGLSDLLSRHKSSVGKNVTKLHADGFIYISGWVRGEDTDGDAAPKYSIRESEDQVDKPKPKRLSKSEIFKRYWRKNRFRFTIPKRTEKRIGIWTGLVNRTTRDM